MGPGTPGRSRAQRLERALARSASALVMTSPGWASLHGAKWGRPVRVITNGHDNGSTGAAARSPSGRLILGYLGSFYPDKQNLRAAFDAIGRLRANGRQIERLRVIGEIHPRMRAELERRGLGEMLEVTGFLPHAEAAHALSSCSALLFAGPSDGRAILRGEIAGKLFEYLASGLPIIYVGVGDCDAARLLARHPGTHLLATDDADGVARALRSINGARYRRDLAELSREALTGQLAKLLDEVCG